MERVTTVVSDSGKMQGMLNSAPVSNGVEFGEEWMRRCAGQYGRSDERIGLLIGAFSQGHALSVLVGAALFNDL